MQPITFLRETLDRVAAEDQYLFAAVDFLPLFPDLSIAALRMLLSRASRQGLLVRVCRGIYLYPRSRRQKGFELYHTAARLRERDLSYLSLESVLSEAGRISQIPLGWITLMTRGRSGIIHCGSWGAIEFIHTRKKPEAIMPELIYDERYRLWRASVPLALRDMRDAKRPMDLVEEADELF
jgi:hypothetical protein